MNDRTEDEREEVLFSFAVEPEHDRATLGRYLALYPHLAEDLIDLSLDLRLQRAAAGTSAPSDEAWVEESWAAFQASFAVPTAAFADPFAAASSEELLALRRTLGVPSGVIQGFSTRLVEIATVPAWIVDRIASGLRTSVDELRGFMEAPNRLTPGLSYKADGMPASVEAKVTFEELLTQCRVPEDKRRELLEERN